MIEGVGDNIKKIIKTVSMSTELNELKKILKRIESDFKKIKKNK